MLTLTKYEQSGFTIARDGITLGVDIGSYTSEENLAAIGHPAAALVSHIHSDHFNEENLQRLGCPIYTVDEVFQAIADPKLKVVALRFGVPTPIEGTPFTVTALFSDHGPNLPQPVENAAFLITDGDHSIYFLGDMAVPSPAPEESYDLVLTPVGWNGGFVFGPHEAADFIRSLSYRGLIVPIHYHGNADPQAPEHFLELMEGFAEVEILGVGESLELE